MQKVIEFDALVASIFGSGIFLSLWRLGTWINKLVKAKRDENELREREIRELKKVNAEQDQRLTKVEEYQMMAEDRSQDIMKAEKASLHNQIWNKADEYIKRGYITVGELNNFDYLFQAYKSLGGNGTGDTLHRKICNLDVRDEGILQKDEIDRRQKEG
ncbi:hypothetical protein [Enterococcus olivae]